MNMFFRFMEWCRRLGRVKGFGIQSPTDYRFVREVVGERWPYYAYHDIQQLLKGESRKTVKQAKLFFRVANHVQPDQIIGLRSPLMTQVMAMGCRKAKCSEICDTAQINGTADGKRLLVLNCRDLPDETDILSGIGDGSVVIVQDINHDGPTRKKWLRLLERGNNIVVFDLYHCAIVMSDRNRYKQIYYINF